jgi:uncharacterized protein involved in exopolysaccharide biosynthesis
VQAAPLTPDDIVREIVLYWWQRRKWLAKVLAVAIICYAVILLLIPNRFRAEAKVIILPPKFTAEIRTEPLSVITAKNLLLSGEMIEKLIQTIRDARPYAQRFLKQYETPERAAEVLHSIGVDGIARKLGDKAAPLAPFFARWGANELAALAQLRESELADWTIELVGQSLDCEEIIEKKTAADIKMSPLLNLTAVADSGPKAQLLVNTWALLFEKKYDELANEKTRFQYDYILTQEQGAEKELDRQQRRIVEFKARNNLELLLREIDEYSSKYRDYLSQLVTKRHDRELLIQKLKESQDTVNALQKDGLWVGEIPPEEVMNPHLAEQEATRTLDVESSNSPYELARERTLETRQRLLYYLAQLVRFQEKEPVELLDKELGQLQSDYLATVGRLRNAEARVAVLRGALQSLDAVLSTTERILVLWKDVPDQSIAEALRTGQPQQLKTLAGVQFRREELNPAWTMLFEQRVKLEAEYQQALAEVQELGPRAQQYEKDSRDLQVRVYRARLAEKMLTESVDLRRKSLQAQLECYLNTRNQIHDGAIDLGLLNSEIAELERETSMTKAHVEELQNQYNRASAELQLMEMQLRAVQRNADLLTQKLQDARMAIAQPVSDVSIAAFAPTPTKHYFPPRTLALAGLTILTAAILLAFLGRVRYEELKRL